MIPKYISAEEYARQSGMGAEEVKRQCRIGEIPCKMTEKGHYKIPIYDDAVPVEEYNKLKDENTKLKTILQQFNTTINTLVWREVSRYARVKDNFGKCDDVILLYNFYCKCINNSIRFYKKIQKHEKKSKKIRKIS